MATRGHKQLKIAAVAAAASTSTTEVEVVAVTSEAAEEATVVAFPTDLPFR